MFNIEKLKLLGESIEKYDKIAILCHVVPDHDSVGSTNALKKIINKNYKNKEVVVLAQCSSYFEYFAPNICHDNFVIDENVLIISLDCANIERLSYNLDSNINNIIKIDHHPPRDNYGFLNIVNDKISSTCEYLYFISKQLNWELDKDIVTLLYLGIIGDTGRFLFKNTSKDTYKCVSELFNYGLDPKNDVYPHIYKIQLKDIKNKAILTKQLLVLNHFGVILLTKKMMESLGINPLDVSKFTNQFGNISTLKVWIVIVEEDDIYKCSIRSKKHVINEIAAEFGGGGHMYASGVKVPDLDSVVNLISKLYKVANECDINNSCSCFEYLKKKLQSK